MMFMWKSKQDCNVTRSPHFFLSTWSTPHSFTLLYFSFILFDLIRRRMLDNIRDQMRQSSSPPPQIQQSPVYGHSTPSGSPSPLPGLSHAHSSGPQKRPLEDMTQFANSVSCSTKLRKTDHDNLLEFAQLPPAEQRIWMAAKTLKLCEQQENLNPPEVLYVIPKKIETRIAQQSPIIIMDPTISAYLSGDVPVNLLLKLFDMNANWGLDATIQENKSKLDLIVSRMHKKFTGHRNVMKLTINNSLGRLDPTDALGTRHIDVLNIVDLCGELVKLHDKKMKLTVTIPMCARVAYLRVVFTEKRTFSVKDQQELSYWDDIDADLACARQDYPTAKILSKYFGMILANDCSVYGDANLDIIPKSGGPAAPMASPLCAVTSALAATPAAATGTPGAASTIAGAVTTGDDEGNLSN
ncbi:hypothetical protein B0H34DRAFT_863066 [Crassisporium funariophilum]|nr:hypothetical protein B0H34DRAFT_863066 [Crassisporium funariophilum]